MPNDVVITDEAILAANRRHDAEHGKWWQYKQCRVKSRWPESIVRGKLSDKQIARYEELGFYSDGFKQARREAMAKRKRRLAEL